MVVRDEREEAKENEFITTIMHASMYVYMHSKVYVIV